MSKPLSLEESLKQIQKGAGHILSTKHGHLRVIGSDAASYLHRLTSNNVLDLPVGQDQTNALLDRKGMVLSLFHLIRLTTDKFYLATPGIVRQRTHEILEKNRFRDQVAFEDVSESSALLTLVGSQVSDIAIPDSLKTYRESSVVTPILNICGPRDQILEFEKKLSFEAPLLDPQALRLAHIKSGIPEYGVDIDETHLLLEAPIPVAYQRNKGCYPGQEVVERIASYGKGRAPRTLCALASVGSLEISKGEPVLTAEKELAGTITSALFDPLENKTYFLAYLEHKFTDGTKPLSTRFGSCEWVNNYNLGETTNHT